MIAEQARPV